MPNILESKPVRLWIRIVEDDFLNSEYNSMDLNQIRRVRNREESLPKELTLIEQYLHSIPAPDNSHNIKNIS